MIMAPLTSCSPGVSLCCGYETSQDITSDVSIIRDGGNVVLQNVSAIIETHDRYTVEVRPFESDAADLRYQACTYAFIDKKSGEIDAASIDEVKIELDHFITTDSSIILKTKNSCLVD